MVATLETVVGKYGKLIQRMDDLVLRCLGLIDDGDRVAYWLQDSYTFLTGELTGQDLNLNNPADATFYATRLNIFLGSRLVNETDPTNSELTFRPEDWTPVNDYTTAAIKACNGVFSLRSSRGEYSNVPTSIALAFSQRHGVPGTGDVSAAGSYMPVSAYIGALDFERPFVVPRGESATLKFTPSYTRALAVADATATPQYRVTALLQGYKLARAFR